jgi:hypothetical protein
VIVELGLADSESVAHAVRQSRQPGQRLGAILVETGALTEEELSRAIAERHGLDHVDLEEFELDLEAASLISPSVASRYDAIPIAFAADGALIVALEDPVNPLVINDLEVMTKSEVRIAVATGAAIRAEIERLERLAQARALESEADAEPDPASTAPRDEFDRLRARLAAAEADRERLREELRLAVEDRQRSGAELGGDREAPAPGEAESLRAELGRVERLARDALAAAEEAKRATDKLTELRRADTPAGS